MDEALPLIDAFLRGDPVDHDGEHYRVNATLSPAAMQRPRPPIWVAATLPHRKPIERAKRWDGVFPLNSATGPGPLTPAELSELVIALDPPAGYDVVTALSGAASPSELADAGATWGIDGPAGPGEPISEVRRRVDAGPPA